MIAGESTPNVDQERIPWYQPGMPVPEQVQNCSLREMRNPNFWMSG